MISTYHLRKTPKCKYCDKLAKHNITPDGRNKGYCKTCGDDKCLRERFLDEAVNRKKKYSSQGIEMSCEKCGKVFIKESYQQKWCKTCVPNKSARAILHRYDLSASEYSALLLRNDGVCGICLKRKVNVIDHDHVTGKVRGAICNGCNVALHLVENPEALSRALVYLGKV